MFIYYFICIDHARGRRWKANRVLFTFDVAVWEWEGRQNETDIENQTSSVFLVIETDPLDVLLSRNFELRSLTFFALWLDLFSRCEKVRSTKPFLSSILVSSASVLSENLLLGNIIQLTTLFPVDTLFVIETRLKFGKEKNNMLAISDDHQCDIVYR